MDQLVALSGSAHAVLVVCTVDDQVFADDFSYEEALRLLPLVAQAKVNAKRVAHDRYVALSNRLLQLCVSRIETGREEVRFSAGKYGKPYLEDSLAQFSMTNGEKYVCMFVVKPEKSINGLEVGIDIASTNDFTSMDDLALYKEVLSDGEYAELAKETDLSTMKTKFAFYWSLKECYTKYLGVGLNFDLKTIDGSKLSHPSSTTIQVTNVINNLLFKSFWVDNSEIVTYCYPRLNIQPITIHVNISDVIEYMQNITH